MIDVSTWTPEQRAHFCEMWNVLKQNQALENLTEDMLEAAYQLGLLPRPSVTIELRVDGKVYGGVLTLVEKENI